MAKIEYIDRLSGKKETEQVYKDKAVKILYQNTWYGNFLRQLVSRSSLFSRFYGWSQNLPLSKKKIAPFVQKFQIDSREFVKEISQFKSFNDFFIRRLKQSARPIDPHESSAIIPADGRYLFYPNIAKSDGFLIKGQKFDLGAFLKNKALAEKYHQGSMVIARLCPTDYHRFHFPCNGKASKSLLINGYLYSVNPLALKQNIHIFSENKRMISELQSDLFGTVLMVEVGATCVGTIKQTYDENHRQRKGYEKGYFAFGGSSIVLLFEPERIYFEEDLLKASEQKIEIKCLMGQRMGTASS